MRVENYILNTPRQLDTQRTKAMETPAGFKDILKDLVLEAQTLRERDMANNDLLATGKADSLDRVMVDMEKADIALQFTMQVRNKILDAYQEIMRMQI